MNNEFTLPCDHLAKLLMHSNSVKKVNKNSEGVATRELRANQIFLTRVLLDCLKHLYAYLNEGDKVCECYNCLKIVMQGHLHDFFS